MIILQGLELRRANKFLRAAQEEAKKSTCSRRQCGAVIVKNGVVVGKGFNSPPKNLESQRRCGMDKSSLDRKVTDSTCCVHAERRAVSNALRKRLGATIYFTSIDDKGGRLLSGSPYCTDCSKMALDEGINYWILEHVQGVVLYDAKEYNNISFNYGKS